MTTFATFQTKFGLAVEVTQGVAPATNPTKLLPVIPPPKPEDMIPMYTDKGLRGIAAESFGHYQLQSPGTTIPIDGPFYPDAAGYFPMALLGTEAAVIAAPANTTTTGTNNAGATTLTVTSGTGYVNNAAILIGTGATQEANVILSGGGTTTLTLAGPLRFTHSAADTVSGGTLHQFSLATAPKTLTAWDFFGVDWRQYVSCMVEEFDLKWAAHTEATYAAKVRSFLSTVPATPTAPGASQVPPFMGWQAGMLFAGTGQTNIMEANAAWKRKTVPVPGANNSLNPVSIFGAEVSLSGKARFQMGTEGEYNHFRNADNPTMKLALFGPAPGAVAGIGATGMVIQASQPAWAKARILRDKEFIEVEVDYEADYNSTDLGNSTVYLTNAYSAVYS